MKAGTTTFEVLTLFPEAIRAFASAGLLGRALERRLVDLHCTDIRDFATGRHRTVDDAPFGGGAGVVMKPEPVVAALESVIAARGPLHRILLTPAAPRFDHAAAVRLAALPRIGLICGRYEGIDERVREHFVDECLSLGDFVLGGGEVAALAIIEAVSRLCEGVVGNPESVERDSFAEDPRGPRLEYPQYTRPAEFRGWSVPQVLLGGDHQAIERWRADRSLARTWALRPDLRRRAAPRPPHSIRLVVEQASLTQASTVAELCGRHGLKDLIILGRPEDAVPWSAALGGRIQVAVFADLQTLRRRLRRGGRSAWCVALDAGSPPQAVENPPAASAAELVDRLTAVGPGAQPGTLVLLAPGISWPSGVDATFRPETPTGPHAQGDAYSELALASSPAIAESSRPLPGWGLVDRALAQLTAICPQEPRSGQESR